MRPPTIYLAGPINGCNDTEANDWRNKFMGLLPQCAFLNPMVRDYRGRESRCASEIVKGDKDNIKDADIVLAYCWRPSWGTAMEVLFGHDSRKAVIVVVPEGRISPWLSYHADVVLRTLEDAVSWIKDYWPL